jgi:hypothetical protein
MAWEVFSTPSNPLHPAFIDKTTIRVRVEGNSARGSSWQSSTSTAISATWR